MLWMRPRVCAMSLLCCTAWLKPEWWWSMMRRLHDLLRLPSTRRTLAIEATFYLLAACIALQLLPFRVLEWFFEHQPQRPEITGPARTKVREEVRWAMNFASFRLQIRATCFARAIAAQCMLRWRGMGTILYLGA